MSIDPRFMDEQLGIDRGEMAKRYKRLADEAVNSEGDTKEEVKPKRQRKIAYNVQSGEGQVGEPNFDREAAQENVQRTFQQQPPIEHYAPEPTYEEERPPRIIGGSDQQAWPGGPLQSEILAWKKQFGAVFKSVVPTGETFVWRTLNRYEYKQIMAIPNSNELSREEMIAEVCVLFPYEYSYEDMVNAPGGIPSILSEQIMKKSGFTRQVTVEAL